MKHIIADFFYMKYIELFTPYRNRAHLAIF